MLEHVGLPWMQQTNDTGRVAPTPYGWGGVLAVKDNITDAIKAASNMVDASSGQLVVFKIIVTPPEFISCVLDCATQRTWRRGRAGFDIQPGLVLSVPVETGSTTAG